MNLTPELCKRVLEVLADSVPKTLPIGIVFNVVQELMALSKTEEPKK